MSVECALIGVCGMWNVLEIPALWKIFTKAIVWYPPSLYETHTDVVHCDLKSTLRVLYALFTKYKSTFQSAARQQQQQATPTSPVSVVWTHPFFSGKKCFLKTFLILVGRNAGFVVVCFLLDLEPSFMFSDIQTSEHSYRLATRCL